MNKKARIVRMVTPDHLCPWGVKAKDLLERNDYEIEDEHLDSMDANKAYKEENGYDAPPQIFIEGVRVGGYEALRNHLGMEPEEKEGKTYQPVLAIFAVTFLMSITTAYAMTAGFPPVRIIELFIAFSMCVLGIQKLQDLSAFTTGFRPIRPSCSKRCPLRLPLSLRRNRSGYPHDRGTLHLGGSARCVVRRDYRCNLHRQSSLH